MVRKVVGWAGGWSGQMRMQLHGQVRRVVNLEGGQVVGWAG